MSSRFSSWAAPALFGLVLLLQVSLLPVCAYNPGPEAAVVSPDGSRVYVNNSVIPAVQVISTASNRLVATIPIEHGAYLPGLAVSPDGTRLYVTNLGELLVIDTAAEKVVATVAVGEGPGGVAVSRDGKRVYVANELSNTVSVVDTTALQAVATVPVGSGPSDLAISADGRWVYVSNQAYLDHVKALMAGLVSIGDTWTDTLSVIDTASNRVVSTVAVGVEPSDVVISPDGKRVYVTDSTAFGRQGEVDVIDTASGQVIAFIGNPQGSPTEQFFPYDMAVSPDGTRLYVNDGRNEMVWVVDTAANRIVATVRVGNGSISPVVNPDGTRLYVANQYDNTLSVIDTARLQVVTTLALGHASAYGN